MEMKKKPTQRGNENEENRKAQIISTAMANEGKSGEKYDDYLDGLLVSLGGSFSGGYTAGGSYTGSNNRGGRSDA